MRSARRPSAWLMAVAMLGLSMDVIGTVMRS
jgi:hypothetical protein